MKRFATVTGALVIGQLTGALFDDSSPPRGAYAGAAVRPLRALPPSLHTADELGQRPVYA